MKKFYLLTKTLLVATVLLVVGASNVWGDDVVVPTPVYFQNFEGASTTKGDAGSNFGIKGATLTGSGAIKTGDPLFGQYYKNAEGVGSQSTRANYLTITTTAFSGMNSPKATTISFWMNANGSWGNEWGSIFVAYGSEGNTRHGYPFSFDTRARLAVHSSLFETHFDDNGSGFNNWRTSGADYASSWHHVALVYSLDESDPSAPKVVVKQYIDGELKQTYNKANANGDHPTVSMFDHFEQLTEFVIGGNSPVWSDPDNNYAYDEIAIYNVALTDDQVSQIKKNKLSRTATGTQIGNQACNAGYVSEDNMTSKITLKPGESYHYSFINYNNGGIDNFKNYVIPVYNTNGDRVITVRSDYWEDMHHIGSNWGSNAGCSAEGNNWTNWIGKMNGANVDMTVSFGTDKIFTMNATITNVDKSVWKYSYTNNYTDSPIDLTSNDHVKVALAVSSSWLDLLSEGYSAVSATITPAGWCTFTNDNALDLSTLTASEGTATAYYASAAEGSEVTLTPTTAIVPAGTGIMIKGNAGATVSIPVTSDAPTFDGTNFLKGQTTTGNVAASGTDGKYHYVFGYVTETPSTYGFYNLTEDTSVLAGKAYLETISALSAGLSARAISIVLADEILTGIDQVDNGEIKSFLPVKRIVNGKLVIEKKGMMFNANGARIY